MIRDWMGRHAARRVLTIAAMASLLVAGGCNRTPDPAPKVADASSAAPSVPAASAAAPACIEGSVAYYYRYKDATPNQSDIAFIEVLPPGQRCVAASTKKAPVFPDQAVSADVASGAMKIEKPLTGTAHVSRDASMIAVYYKTEGSPPTSNQLLVVEDLSNVERDIVIASVLAAGDPSAGSCGGCAEYRCDGGTCCKRPPCP